MLKLCVKAVISVLAVVGALIFLADGPGLFPVKLGFVLVAFYGIGFYHAFFK